LFVIPKYLSSSSKKWIQNIVKTWSIDEHHFRLLVLIGETWDQIQLARKAVEQHGSIYTDRFGCPRSRPEVNILRDNKVIFARLLRELNLSEGPDDESIRLPRISGERGLKGAI
jgi:hypothetical protein